MELTELKETWEKMSIAVEKQKNLTDKMIMDVTKLKFSNKISTILKYEGLGTIVLFFAVIVISTKIELFDTIPLQIAVFITLLIMLLLPVLSCQKKL